MKTKILFFIIASALLAMLAVGCENVATGLTIKEPEADSATWAAVTGTWGNFDGGDGIQIDAKNVIVRNTSNSFDYEISKGVDAVTTDTQVTLTTECGKKVLINYTKATDTEQANITSYKVDAATSVIYWKNIAIPDALNKTWDDLAENDTKIEFIGNNVGAYTAATGGTSNPTLTSGAKRLLITTAGTTVTKYTTYTLLENGAVDNSFKTTQMGDQLHNQGKANVQYTFTVTDGFLSYATQIGSNIAVANAATYGTGTTITSDLSALTGFIVATTSEDWVGAIKYEYRIRYNGTTQAVVRRKNLSTNGGAFHDYRTYKVLGDFYMANKDANPIVAKTKMSYVDGSETITVDATLVYTPIDANVLPPTILALETFTLDGITYK